MIQSTSFAISTTVVQSLDEWQSRSHPCSNSPNHTQDNLPTNNASTPWRTKSSQTVTSWSSQPRSTHSIFVLGVILHPRTTTAIIYNWTENRELDVRVSEVGIYLACIIYIFSSTELTANHLTGYPIHLVSGDRM